MTVGGDSMSEADAVTVQPARPTQHDMKTTELTWLLSGLREDSQYSCEARAYTRIGPGPFTNPAIGRTDEPPPSMCFLIDSVCLLKCVELVALCPLYVVFT